MRDLDGETERTPRRWTGRGVLLALVGSFGVVFIANGTLIHEALSTMSGLDTDSAYQAGQQFEHEVAQAKAQDERHWNVDAKVTPALDGARLDIFARDATGHSLGGLDASAVLERPTDRRLDREIVLVEDSAGRFHGSAAVPAGQWDLVIELSHHGEQLFRSRNRVVLR